MDAIRSHLDHETAAIAALAALLVGVVLFVVGRKGFALARRARALPLSRLDRLTDDALVRVRGRVVKSDDAITAPVSGRAAVYVLLELFARRANAPSSSIGGAREVTLVTEKRFARCVISDQHGTLEIPLAKVRVLRAPRDVVEGPIDGAPAAVRDALRARHGGESLSGLFYREHAVFCGDEVSAIGTVRRAGGGRTLTKGAVPCVVAKGDAPALTGAIRARAFATTIAGLSFVALSAVLLAFARGFLS